ncbi:MAG: hypothetical protein GWM98_00165, partial [Nitrospinaceae bacterium]|nr:hypothetical protein [Nitrospinaceae bacterium]NIR53225.1 hypothetical protein [Nitrospinaceae bacterium]NIS83620.1 hypothetical protein [Nitrospinaceae bacterium]NIT80410.1 hypothetical protein [Nitrospinaceae bacterium]NIU42753.1 hypothetical protein [Nitrospinaceae bacterium]
MSAKLFTDPKQNQSTKQKQIRKIDDLILDAEKEAESEINRRIRSSNIRLVLIIAIGAGLIYMVNQGIQDKTIPFPSFLPEEPQVAKAPSIRKPTPKPIPFPVNESGEPATEEEPSDSASNDEMKENISPLENEVLSMLQSNLDDQPSKSPAPAGGEGLQSLPPKPAAGGKKSPFTPPPDQAAAPTTQEPRKLSQTLEPGRKLKVPSSTPMGSGANYFVQVGAFSVKSNADQVIKKLMSNGYSPL